MKDRRGDEVLGCVCFDERLKEAAMKEGFVLNPLRKN